MISRDGTVVAFRWLNVESLIDEVIKNRNPVIADWISPTKPQFKRAVKDSTVRQRVLTDSASLFSTPLLLVSLAEHVKATKMSLQIVAVKEAMGLNRPQSGGVSFNASYQVGKWQKPRSLQIRPLPPAICSTIYSLDSAKSSRLVSDALDKFSPLIEYWNLYRTDIYRIHRGLANQTVPVRDVSPSRLTVPLTPADQRYKIWVSWSKCLCEDVSAIAADWADLLSRLWMYLKF